MLLHDTQAGGPSVSQSESLAHWQQALPSLENLEQNPQPLVDYLESHHGLRVGRYFEALMNYWLRNIATVKVVVNNFQIQDGKRTVGELDFLFQNETGLIHWEAAVKYYLQHTPRCTAGEFIGPNTADNLGSKLGRIFTKQLPRSTPGVLRQVLGDTAVPPAIERKAYVKGWLFYPPGQVESAEPPLEVSCGHSRGFWIHHGSAQLPPCGPHKRWALLRKPYWLAPMRIHCDDGLMSATQIDMLLDSHFASRTTPLLLALVEPINGGFQECLRGFVVPKNWPA